MSAVELNLGNATIALTFARKLICHMGFSSVPVFIDQRQYVTINFDRPDNTVNTRPTAISWKSETIQDVTALLIQATCFMGEMGGYLIAYTAGRTLWETVVGQ